MLISNNSPLKAGYIFIPEDKDVILASFKSHRAGSFGHFAKLTPDSINGWEAVTFREYSDA